MIIHKKFKYNWYEMWPHEHYKDQGDEVHGHLLFLLAICTSLGSRNTATISLMASAVETWAEHAMTHVFPLLDQ